MPRTKNLPFQKNLLAIAMGAALTPAWALDLVQEPPLPTSKSAFVAPNVIISVDDSGSMDYCSNAESETECVKNINNSQRTTGTTYSCNSGYTLYSTDNCRSDNRDNTKRSGSNGNYSCSSGYVLNGNNCYKQDNSQLISTPTYSCPSGTTRDTATNDCYTWGGATEETAPINGSWPVTSRRINVLKYSLNKVFTDTDLIPDGKIRLAWQAMWNNGGSPGVGLAGDNGKIKAGAGSVNSTTFGVNSMKPLQGGATTANTHRKNFLDFAGKLSANNGTPSHRMFSQADGYMRLSPSDNKSPWSTDPGGTGSKGTEYLGCRRNYHIMMTDGRWNGTATALPDLAKRDNATDLSIGGGKATYSGTDSALYRDTSAGTTLADWAFYSWTNPLQTGTALKDADKLKPSLVYDQAPDTEVFGTGTDQVTLKKFWNPKYNPATWPHMVTYTIGFSQMAYDWDYSQIKKPTQMAPFGYDGSLPALAKGTTTWPDLTASTESRNALDLWHAALNGRGRFYAIQQGAELENAFREIIGKINEESAPLPDNIAGGGSTSGYNVSQSNAGIFASVYSPKDGWKGYITATRAIEPEQYACPTKDDPAAKCIRFPDTIAGWEGKSTADRLDALTAADIDNRLVLSWGDDASTGIPFKWTSAAAIGYSTAQKLALLGVTSGDTTQDPLKTQGQNIVNYIRGDRSLEGTTTDKPLRVRYSRQGDVVNSEIWYTGRPIGNYAMGYSSFVTAQKNRTPILYVGGNDGMLHGFSATDGKELIAYVPRGVVGGLKDLTDKDYQHRYYVDGSPMTGDIKDGTTWKTLLVGALGAGGKGYFVLNVTNPAGFGSAAAADLVVLDRTRAKGEAVPDCSALSGAAKTTCEDVDIRDIGNIVAQPGRNPANLQEATQITRMNNGRWAVVMGNGYNSTNQRPVLLVQYLDGDKALKRIQATTVATGTGNANDNGLASPALVDLNGDGKTDVVYAGDNLGNLWKFDLTSTDDTKWKVALDNNTPLFTTRGPVALGGTRNQVQPITAPPIVRPNDRTMTVGTGAGAKTFSIGGMMVAFGTGRNLTANDRRTDITQNVQTLYSVLDNTRYRMNTDKTALEVHPGTGDCATAPATCVPTPTPVGTIANDGTPLAKQTITTVSGDDATVNATQELKKETWKDYKGWYLDLPFTGERLLKPMQFFDGSNILAVYSESPSGTKNSESDNINESCVPVKVDTSAGSQFRTLVNIMDGKTPTVQLVDTDNNGVYNSADQKVARVAVKTGTPVLITKRDRIVDLTGGGGARDTLNRMPEQSMRPSWRQLK
jgi:type IV pilus assembly protein PilY1